ncbi:MAG: glutathione S-transferase N-terminal domain-containing protein [Pseudomonadota bacterium]
MILRSRDPSPFGRKVKIVAKLTGHYDGLTVEEADTADPSDSIRKQNPLGKIPALILDDGGILYDSRVICEYFDAHSKSGTRVLADDETRFDQLRLQALGDGVMDAGIVQVYEIRMRPEDKRHAPWTAYQQEKIDRTLAALAADLPSSDAVHIGTISLACALAYLDIRFDGTWRNAHPALATWLEAFASNVPAFGETTPVV